MDSLIGWFTALDSATKATWIGAGGTIIAAIAAGIALWFTAVSARAAANAAKAAGDQVELQRPRPIIIPEFQYSWAQNRGNMAAPNFRDFQLRNIGDSPAFDAEMSVLEICNSRLETEPFSYLLPGDPLACTHRLSPARGMSGPMGPAVMFLEDAKVFFDEQSKYEATRRPDYRYEIPFTTSYRSLEGRRFTQPWVLVVHFPSFSAWVEPVGSLLGATPRSEAI